LFLSTIYTIFSNGIWDVILIQIILDSISCVVIAFTTYSIFDKGFWVSGVLSAFNLNMVILSASLLTDTLFLFLFNLFLFSLIKYLQNNSIRYFFFLVLFISLATLVRASSYYLIFILLIWLVGWMVHQRKSFLKIGSLVGMYIAIVMILLGGVLQHNYHQYGSMALASDAGKHLIGWVVPATYQYSGQGSYQQGQLLAKERLKLALQRDNLTKLPPNPFENSAYKADVGKDILLDFGFLNILKAWIVGSTINLLAPSVAYAPVVRLMDHPSFYETKGSGVLNKLSNYIKNSSGFFYLLILVIGTTISIIFTFLALVGVVKMLSSLSLSLSLEMVSTLLLLVGYFLAITGPVIGVKYRLPIEPVMIIFIAYAISTMEWKKNKEL
jgi:hypothetical protein